MIYGKLINETIDVAPNVVTIDDKTVCNPTEEQLLSLGYYPVHMSEMPETDAYHYAQSSWKQEDSAIIQIWTIVPSSSSPTAEERLSAVESALLALMGGE